MGHVYTGWRVCVTCSSCFTCAVIASRRLRALVGAVAVRERPDVAPPPVLPRSLLLLPLVPPPPFTIAAACPAAVPLPKSL